MKGRAFKRWWKRHPGRKEDDEPGLFVSLPRKGAEDCLPCSSLSCVMWPVISRIQNTS